MPDLVDRFEELFRGNSDAYGLVVGRCVREDVTRLLWEAHVLGRGSLGIYPTKRSGTGGLYCRWGCSDIDTHGSGSVSPAEAKVQAKNLVTALGVLGHKAWPELTKCGGYHVWVFANSWTPAVWVRHTLLLAHQLAEVPAREVNPKDAEGNTELGNYVNLPYAREWTHYQNPPSRFVFDVETGMVLPVEEFVAAALNERSTPESFEESAKLYTPPPPPKPVTVRPYSELRALLEARSADVKRSKDVEDDELRFALEKLGGAGFLRWRDGPRPGEGRNHTLFLLGDDCVQSGLTPDETLLVLVDADWRWGKFMSGVDGHRNGITYIEDIVRKVHG